MAKHGIFSKSHLFLFSIPGSFLGALIRGLIGRGHLLFMRMYRAHGLWAPPFCVCVLRFVRMSVWLCEWSTQPKRQLSNGNFFPLLLFHSIHEGFFRPSPESTLKFQFDFFFTQFIIPHRLKEDWRFFYVYIAPQYNYEIERKKTYRRKKKNNTRRQAHLGTNWRAIEFSLCSCCCFFFWHHINIP